MGSPRSPLKTLKQFVEGRNWILTSGLVTGIDTWAERNERHAHLLRLQTGETRCGFAFFRKTAKELPKVSIVIPCYNSAVAIFEETLLSALAQSYPNIEIVVVDDGSSVTDHCDLARRYASRYPNLVLTQCSQNGGISKARNTGIQASTGIYIAFLDHDDLLHPYAVELNIMLMLEHQTSFQHSYECLLRPDGVSYAQFLSKGPFSKFTLLHYNYICHFVTVEKSLLSKIEQRDGHIFDTKADGAEDHDLYLRLCELEDFRPGVTPAFLYYWRISPTSTAGDQSQKPASFAAADRASRRSAALFLGLPEPNLEIIRPEGLSELRTHPLICIQPNSLPELPGIDVLSFGPHPSALTKMLGAQQLLELKVRTRKHFSTNAMDEFPAMAIAQYLSEPERAPYVFIHYSSIAAAITGAVWKLISLLDRLPGAASVGAALIDDERFPKPLSDLDPSQVLGHSSYQRSARYGFSGSPRVETERAKGTFAFESHETLANSPICVGFTISEYRAAGGLDWQAFPRRHAWLDLSLRQRQQGKCHVNLGVGLFAGKLLPRFESSDQHNEDILLLKRHWAAISDMTAHTSYDFLHHAAVTR